VLSEPSQNGAFLMQKKKLNMAGVLLSVLAHPKTSLLALFFS
jgi:hypothetical protein